MNTNNMKQEKEKKGREDCMVATTDKLGVIQDVVPYTALLTAIKEKGLSYNVVSRRLREEGYFIDDRDKDKNFWFFKKNLVKSEYKMKTTKKRINNLKPKK